jgi:hypothetical protein
MCPGQDPGRPASRAARSRADLLLHDILLLAGDRLAVVPATEPAHQVPGGVAAQDLPLLRVGAAAEDIADEAFQPGHLLIAGRQRPGGDQHAAHVRENRGLRQAVQLAVAEITTASRDTEPDGNDGRLGEPARRGAGRVGGPQRFLQPADRGADAAVRAGQQFPQPQLKQAVGALARPRAVSAGWAVGERGDGAVMAARLRQRARADRPDQAADAASCQVMPGSARPSGDIAGHEERRRWRFYLP